MLLKWVLCNILSLFVFNLNRFGVVTGSRFLESNAVSDISIGEPSPNQVQDSRYERYMSGSQNQQEDTETFTPSEQPPTFNYRPYGGRRRRGWYWNRRRQFCQCECPAYPYYPPEGNYPNYPNVPPNGFPNTPPNGFPTVPPNGFPTVPPNGFPSVPPNGFPSNPPNGFPSVPPNAFPPRSFPTTPSTNDTASADGSDNTDEEVDENP